MVINGRDIDHAATATLRAARLSARLAEARPAVRPVTGQVTPKGAGLPLYPGVAQCGRFAVSERSGAVLAQAPAPWTDGCPTIHSAWMSRAGIELATIAYLDPLTGHTLAVDSRVNDGRVSFASLPERWAGA